MKTITNVDTIYILVDINNYEKNANNILQMLIKEKENALLKVGNTKHIITISNINFEILSNGCKGYAFILRNDNYEIKISQFEQKIENFSPIQIRISSQCLWANGIEKSWAIIEQWLLNTFRNIKSNKVCRLDLCCHVSNMDFITDYENSYKGHFKKYDKTFHTGNSINSITFGSRKGKNIYCRIYNKTLEVKETKKKMWFFDIWKSNGLDIDNVWNLEFEIKSECLRNFNISSVNECIENIPAIWKYCTSEWLVKIDKINSRTNRCPTNTQWLEIQNAFSNTCKSLIKKDKQILADANTLIPNIIGNITSYSAYTGLEDINEAFNTIRSSSVKYLYNKETSFKEEVQRKSRIKNLTMKGSEAIGK